MTHLTTPDEQLASLRRIIFDHTDGLEERLRMAVVAIRGDKEIYPKAVWTDLIEDIYKPVLASTRTSIIKEIREALSGKTKKVFNEGSSYPIEAEMFRDGDNVSKGYNQAISDVLAILTEVGKEN
jgi:hypothetical protein